MGIRKEYCKKVKKKYSKIRDRLGKIKEEKCFYCKQCDVACTSNHALMQHTFTLKHKKNCGNNLYEKALLIGKRAYQISQGLEPKCSTVGLTNSLDIAAREYDLGLCPLRYKYREIKYPVKKLRK